jgi:hypothetical protein
VNGLTRFTLLLALGLWIGTIACVSFLVAPVTFRLLAPAQAGDVVGAIFPSYYRIGIVVGALAVASALRLRPRAQHPAVWSWTAGLAALGLAATLWAGLIVHPAARERRAALTTAGTAPSSDAEFQRLHHRAVMLNGVALLAALGARGVATRGLQA